MTKKKKITPIRKYQSVSFKVEETILKNPSKAVPVNLAEEKHKFLHSGKVPKFQMLDSSKIHELATKTKNKIRFDLLREAENILENVREEYGEGEYYLEHAYGPRISKEEATTKVLEYIEDNSLTESMKIFWCDNMACSAKMQWTGHKASCNRPELRKYSLWINGSDENNYIRESGIRCLMDHEIGTHFFRTFNEGFQPWFSDRARFGLRPTGSFESQCAEEGLAAIHTILRGRVRLLWGAAFAYYTACKSAEMKFKELFDHLARYTCNQEYRWKQVMRVKRGLLDPNDLGGFGNDQCYFEGAVNILRNIDNIDFNLLMMGKLCPDELNRIRRIVRRDVTQAPNFMKHMPAYIKTLKNIYYVNGLNQPLLPQSPPVKYLKRLDERKSNSENPSSKNCIKVSESNCTSEDTDMTKTFLKDYFPPTQNEPEVKEIDSFSVSVKFVNRFKDKKKSLQEKIARENAMDNVMKMYHKLNKLDSSLDAQIQRMKQIIDQHNWMSDSHQYRRDLKSKIGKQILPVEIPKNEDNFNVCRNDDLSSYATSSTQNKEGKSETSLTESSIKSIVSDNKEPISKHLKKKRKGIKKTRKNVYGDNSITTKSRAGSFKMRQEKSSVKFKQEKSSVKFKQEKSSVTLKQETNKIKQFPYLKNAFDILETCRTMPKEILTTETISVSEADDEGSSMTSELITEGSLSNDNKLPLFKSRKKPFICVTKPNVVLSGSNVDSLHLSKSHFPLSSRTVTESNLLKLPLPGSSGGYKVNPKLNKSGYWSVTYPSQTRTSPMLESKWLNDETNVKVFKQFEVDSIC